MVVRNYLAQVIRGSFLEEAMLEDNKTELDEDSIQENGFPVWKKIVNYGIIMKPCDG